MSARFLISFLEDFELILESILVTCSTCSVEKLEKSKKLILSTAPKRGANSRVCRGIKNGAKTPPGAPKNQARF